MESIASKHKKAQNLLGGLLLVIHCLTSGCGTGQPQFIAEGNSSLFAGSAPDAGGGAGSIEQQPNQPPPTDTVVAPDLDIDIAAGGAAIWLQTIDGQDSIELAIGEEAIVQLWLEVDDGVTLVALDAILRAYDQDFGKDLAFDIVGFNNYLIPDSFMQRTARGDRGSSLPGSPDGYQYIGDDLNMPYDGQSGLVGPRTVLLDEIIIRGKRPDRMQLPARNTLGFPVEGTLVGPQGARVVFVTLTPAGTWELVQFPLEQGIGDLFARPLVIDVR